MKIHLFVEKYDGQDPCVIGAWDEYAVDENSEGFETDLGNHKEEAAKNGGEVRVLGVEIPPGALAAMFDPPAVEGKVISREK